MAVWCTIKIRKSATDRILRFVSKASLWVFIRALIQCVAIKAKPFDKGNANSFFGKWESAEGRKHEKIAQI